MADVILTAGIDVDGATGDVTIDSSEVDANNEYYIEVGDYDIQKVTVEKIHIDVTGGSGSYVVTVEARDVGGNLHTLTTTTPTLYTSLAAIKSALQTDLGSDLDLQDTDLQNQAQ